MKILIVSDTHRRHGNLEKVIEKEKPFDLLIHLGDTEGGEDYIEAVADCPAHIISGNNDFFSYLPKEKEFVLEGRRIFITHGHAYYVSMSEERLKLEAGERKADIVMYGHTHKPSYTEEGGLIILNPGSISFPRQTDRKPTYMVMELCQDKPVKCDLKYL